jgi:hypothetical protein
MADSLPSPTYPCGPKLTSNVNSWSYNFRENPIAEIDILEGIGHQPDNSFSLHTGPNCTFFPGWQTGKNPRTNCALIDTHTNKTN